MREYNIGWLIISFLLVIIMWGIILWVDADSVKWGVAAILPILLFTLPQIKKTENVKLLEEINAKLKEINNKIN